MADKLKMTNNIHSQLLDLLRRRPEHTDENGKRKEMFALCFGRYEEDGLRIHEVRSFLNPHEYEEQTHTSCQPKKELVTNIFADKMAQENADVGFYNAVFAIHTHPFIEEDNMGMPDEHGIWHNSASAFVDGPDANYDETWARLVEGYGTVVGNDIIYASAHINGNCEIFPRMTTSIEGRCIRTPLEIEISEAPRLQQPPPEIRVVLQGISKEQAGEMLGKMDAIDFFEELARVKNEDFRNRNFVEAITKVTEKTKEEIQRELSSGSVNSRVQEWLDGEIRGKSFPADLQKYLLEGRSDLLSTCGKAMDSPQFRQTLGTAKGNREYYYLLGKLSQAELTVKAIGWWPYDYSSQQRFFAEVKRVKTYMSGPDRVALTGGART